ncbi:hypothetical protein Aglo01_05610 [Actinokineospora globicatena]|uniref:Uncharacterized protein n=1 Tax=Actinokineospora globicatena TaxID=103729 RepID=A0A9W6VBZ2_9PSEU|nr:hypothetical protein Aglo01_05610 [Actinokineospora globicatena]GLW82914.1 hypothetical protein Aglo02_05540 [Actinokineospora globicatena]GLW95792.1 hypothetical protein Aglo03_66080 [Actinokineospora globicatena]
MRSDAGVVTISGDLGEAAMDWPPPGWVITFDMVDFDRGKPRFVGIGVVAGHPEPDPYLDRYRLPVRPLGPDHRPVPNWVGRSDIIEAVPPPGW